MAGIRITQDTLGKGLASAAMVNTGRAAAAVHYYAPRVQGHAQQSAPWSDQTGNARQGLKARAGSRQATFWIDLFHTMPYGIWLETRWSGRYAVIIPTILEMGPQVIKGVGEAFAGRRLI